MYMDQTNLVTSHALDLELGTGKTEESASEPTTTSRQVKKTKKSFTERWLNSFHFECIELSCFFYSLLQEMNSITIAL